MDSEMQAMIDVGYLRAHNREVTAQIATPSQKLFLGLVAHGGKSVKEVKALYPNFSTSILYEYAKRVRDNLPMLSNGRPVAISDTRMKEVIMQVKELHTVDKNAILTPESFNITLPEAARKTAEDNNRAAPRNGELSLSTMKTFKKRIQLSFNCSVQTKPITRAEIA
jgi:hypothetical protein